MTDPTISRGAGRRAGSAARADAPPVVDSAALSEVFTKALALVVTFKTKTTAIDAEVDALEQACRGAFPGAVNAAFTEAAANS